ALPQNIDIADPTKFPGPPADPEGFTNVLDEDVVVTPHLNHNLNVLDRITSDGNEPDIINGTWFVHSVPSPKTLKLASTRHGTPLKGDGRSYVISGQLHKGIKSALVKTGDLRNTFLTSNKTAVYLNGVFRDLAVD